jgi:hypothetical protein
MLEGVRLARHPRIMDSWQQLRLMRHRPPGVAAVGERRSVFASALEQSEQLMRAARDVGPAARPLPLFYSLSQAGRAIAAARLGDRWRLSGHGLSEVRKQGAADLLRRQFRFQADGSKAVQEGRVNSFAGVAVSVGSDTPERPIELGAVWAAIPDLLEPATQPPLDAPDWRRALRAHLVPDPPEVGPFLPHRAGPLQLLIDGLPPGLQDDVDASLGELAEYPTAAGAGAMTATGGFFSRSRTTEREKPERIMTTLAANGKLLPWFIWNEYSYVPGGINLALEKVAPMYRDGHRVIVPKLADSLLLPLMLWWVLLFGLSTIARYDPELEQLSRVVDWPHEMCQAATLSSCVVVSSSVIFTPSLNVAPLSTSAISSWPLNRRQRSCAASSSL